MGGYAEQIAHAARKSGQPVPPGCEPATIEANLVFYVEAFDTLKTCRNGGYIPWTAALEYARAYQIPPGHDFDFFWKAIHSMDTAELSNHKEKREADEQFQRLREQDGRNSR